jgi:hypothetical protein
MEERETDWGSNGGYARARESKSGGVLYGFRSCIVTFLPLSSIIFVVCGLMRDREIASGFQHGSANSLNA